MRFNVIKLEALDAFVTSSNSVSLNIITSEIKKIILEC